MSDNDTAPLWSSEQITAFLEGAFPDADRTGRKFVIESLERHRVAMRLLYDDRNLRPGGTIMGPALMALADVAAYAAVFACYGAVAEGSVTTSFYMDFLRKPGPEDMLVDLTLVKPGRTLAVVDFGIRAASSPKLVARGSGTYFVPKSE